MFQWGLLSWGGYRMRPQGSPAELEQRRLRAIDLLQRDIPVHVVAEPAWGSIGAPSADGSGGTAVKAAPPGAAGRSAVDWRAWSSPGRKRPAIARACGRVDASST